jgi:hypothetical protein
VKPLYAAKLVNRPNVGIPTPRAVWIAEALKELPAPISIEEIAVHDFGDIRTVSFAMKFTGCKRSFHPILSRHRSQLPRPFGCPANQSRNRLISDIEPNL